jgi:hypothetical protein
MALTLLETRSIKDTNDELRGKFEGAMIRAAWAVFVEAAETENHPNRLAFAKKVLLDSRGMIEKYYLFYLSNTTIQAKLATATDEEIYYTVYTDLYNSVANADAA